MLDDSWILLHQDNTIEHIAYIGMARDTTTIRIGVIMAGVHIIVSLVDQQQQQLSGYMPQRQACSVLCDRTVHGPM